MIERCRRKSIALGKFPYVLRTDTDLVWSHLAARSVVGITRQVKFLFVDRAIAEKIHKVGLALLLDERNEHNLEGRGEGI